MLLIKWKSSRKVELNHLNPHPYSVRCASTILPDNKSLPQSHLGIKYHRWPTYNANTQSYLNVEVVKNLSRLVNDNIITTG